MSGRVGKIIGGTLAAVLVVGAVSAVWLAVAAQPRSGGDAAAARVSTGTAEVTRGSISERLQVSGTLGFDGTYSVAHLGEPGVLTSTAAADSLVGRGAQLYAVANETVRLLFGSTPAYRDFAAAMTDGPDVRQLEENLVALGMDPNRQIVVDARFTAATTTAIRRWQAAWGLPLAQRTGVLPLGQVVFQPAALRISQVQAAIGTPVGPGTAVLSATSATPMVTAQLTTDRRRLVQVGDKVTVTMAGLPPFPGTVMSIARTATTPQSSNGQNSGPPTVAVSISVTIPAGARDLDQAPVQVSIVRQTRENVLMVPVAALMARPGGGYQVRLDNDQFVQVEPGLFDSVTSKVEVSGNLQAGQKVKVPAE